MTKIREEIDTLQLARKRAAKVKRWHTEFTIQTQTLSDHIFNVIRIYHSIWGEPDTETFKKLMYHDFEEYFLGDLPHWTCNIPDLKNAYADAKDDLLLEYNLKVLPTDRDERIKVCDWIEAIEFMIIEVNLGNNTLRSGLERLWNKLAALCISLPVAANPSIENYLVKSGTHLDYSYIIDGVHK